MLGKIGDLNDNFELDPETHWVKAFRDDGEFYLIEPRSAMELGVWARQRRMDFIWERLTRILRERSSGSASNWAAMQDSSTRTAEPTQPRTFPATATLAVPDKRCGSPVPARHGLLQPVDDLLGGLGMLTAQRPADDDALHGFGHIQP